LQHYGSPGSSQTGLSAAIICWFISATLAERSLIFRRSISPPLNA
jgi:hypothetical protein